MTENKIIQRQIREHFGYLVTDYGFVDDLNVDTDGIYSEVRYKKNNWIISIVTTGGRRYVVSEIHYKGQRRKLVVFFGDKSDEQKLKTKTEIIVEGKLIDEKDQSLNLLNSKLID